MQPRAAFEVGAEIEIVLGDRLGHFKRSGQRGVGGDEFQAGLEIFFDVGPEMELAAGL